MLRSGFARLCKRMVFDKNCFNADGKLVKVTVENGEFVFEVYGES